MLKKIKYLTQAEFDALTTVEEGVEYRIKDYQPLDTVKLNGTALTPVSGAVDIPYSTSTELGVIKVNATYGSSTSSTGVLQGSTQTYERYLANNSVLMSSGTVKNVLANETVKFNESQSLTTEQQTQARTNIGAGAPGTIEFLGSDDT